MIMVAAQPPPLSPKGRNAAGTFEPNVAKTRFGEQKTKRPLAPELDVPAIPKWIRMPVPCPGDRDQQILQITVIGRGADEFTAGSHSGEAATRPFSRSV